MLWSFAGLGKGFSSCAIEKGLIYTTGMLEGEGYLFALHESGTLKWKRAYGPEWKGSFPGTRSTPTIDGTRVYVLSGRCVSLFQQSGWRHPMVG